MLYSLNIYFLISINLQSSYALAVLHPTEQNTENAKIPQLSTYSCLAGSGTYKEKRDFAIIDTYKSVAWTTKGVIKVWETS